MTFLRPIQWYHSQADPIWPVGTLKAGIENIMQFVDNTFRLKFRTLSA
jgi:hypothetical protein